MDQYYTASEAIKKLDIPRSTFFVLVQTGQIPKVNLPLRKQALYPKEEIDKLAAEKVKMLKGIEQEPEKLQFMVPSTEDFEQIVEIDHTLFPGETWMTAKELEQRLPYNSEVTHVLKDVSTNTVLGYVSMSPIKEDILKKLISLEIDETSLKPEGLIPYIPNTPLNCYVISIAARQGSGIAHQIYAGKLTHAIKNYFIELLEQGIIIQHIYAVATTREGDRLAQRLHFQPLTTESEWSSNYEDFRHPYILDLADKTNKSQFVREYQRRLTNRGRRRKRYIKEAKQS